MCTARQVHAPASSVNVTDDGRALSDGWYVAYTHTNYERRGARYISRLGHETYVASQKEWHQWSDRRKLVDRIVIPLVIFVRCTPQAADRLERLSFISYFLRIPGSRNRAVVPDDQIARLRFTLDNAPSAVLFTADAFKKGDAVRIRFGKLAGLTGNVAYSKDGSTSIVITLDYLGCATVQVEAEDLQPL